MMNDLSQLINAVGGLEPIDGKEFAPMAEEELSAIESNLGVRFPELYRTFLMSYGSSMFKQFVQYNSVIRLPEQVSKSGKGNIATFYGKTTLDDAYSLKRRLDFFSGRVPANMIPIADDGGGNQILLAVTGNDFGKVYDWDLENEPFDEEDYFEEYGMPRPPEAMLGNVHLIADSFEDFLKRLEIAD